MHVSEHGVFRHALQSLSLKMHEAKACTVGNNHMVGPFVSMSQLVPQKFFGDYKLTEEDAHVYFFCFEQNITYPL
jgi:hypothetical protein